jgi:hypothetical protein
MGIGCRMTPDRTAQFRSIGAETTAIATGCIAHWPDKLAGVIESTPVSGNDKSMSESVKTSEGTVDDPVSAGPTHPNSTAERLDEHIHSNSNRAALSGEMRAKP